MSRFSIRRILITAALVAAAADPALCQVDARMLRHPDVSETHITFVYAGDVWTVPKTGGTASRLSSPAGEEAFPRFSPDGASIAFTGNYDGNSDVYVLPSGGGSLTRLTHHPAYDRMLDWDPEGSRVLYASSMLSGRKRYNQLFLIDRTGGMPDRLPVPYGEYGALSPDGRTLAFVFHNQEAATWKRYRGGTAPDIFLFDLETLSSRNITRSDANESQPMWHDGTLYFLSDRGPEMRYNVWAYDMESDAVRQVTDFTEDDIHYPAVGPSDIVFEAGGRLHLLDLADETHAPVDVDVVTDRSTLKTRTEPGTPYIRSAAPSPTGKRVVFESRGDLFSLPAEHGAVRSLTHTPGAAERYPVWSPDGENVAYWTDRNGEFQLALRPADGTGEETLLTRSSPGYRYAVSWSPDGSKLVYRDETRTLYVLERASGEQHEIDQDRWSFHGQLENERVSWSPDSRWLAYDRFVDNTHEAVFVYDTESGERHQLTSGFYSDREPVFDPDGKYLYLLTSRSLSPSYSDLEPTWVYANTTRIAAVALSDDVPSPLAPRNDEADTEDETDGASKDISANAEPSDGDGDEGGETDGEEEPEPTVIDLEDFERRIVLLPPDAGNYGDLQAVSGKVLYRRHPRTGAADENHPVLFYDLEAREEKTIIDDASTARLTASGNKLLIANDGAYAFVDVAPEQKMDKRIDTGQLEVSVDPQAEWRQLFSEVWRLYRDFFYDPEMHQVDWERLRSHYGALLDDAVTRWDVNHVVGELIGELNASHTYRGGGDVENAEHRGTGLLGVEWSLENGAYRIARILRGAPWDHHDAQSPLDAPGVYVDEGDYVLAVNGIPLDTSVDPWAAFDGLEDATIELTVNDDPTMDGARRVIVETLNGEEEARLQYLAWVNGMRERVDEASGGRIGYVYVPNTATQGQTELVRQFVAQAHKDGLVIDERFNSGGQLGDRFVELLDRRMYSYIAPRHGPPQPWPTVAHNGPQAMLINGWSGSGGDAFPWYFDQADRGPIIGTRTWGGLIGPAIGHRLIDNGIIVVPPARLYGPDGEWFAEGRGVEPDILIPEDPGALARGTDPQLERAIEEVMNRLEPGAPRHPERPPFVDRSGRAEHLGEDR